MKHRKGEPRLWCVVSLPTRERELKLFDLDFDDGLEGSLPTRERELKHFGDGDVIVDGGSLPTRERELKLLCGDFLAINGGRSLHGSVN